VDNGGSARSSPYVRLAAYYTLLGLAVWLLIRFVPDIPHLLARFREISVLGAAASRGRLVEEATAATESLSQGQWALVTFLSMLTALVLVLPVSWVYMLTKRRSGYDQSVVQTVIILPMTVAATVILVQNSLALAFTLAAIVAAVRFRNTLKDTKDAVYIFLALAVGVAAGVFSPTVAAVMSVMFNLVVLALWELNVGNIYADQRGRIPALSPAEGLLGPRRRSSAALAVGDPDLLAALAPHELEEVADRAARLQAYVMARSGDKKEDRFNGMLLVHTTQPEAAQRVVEELLRLQAQRWRLAEIVPAEQGRSSLEYLIRLRDEFLPATLLDALKGRGSPPIDAAEYRSLRGLKKR
jgi:flagellar biogenesis protein FliO